MFAELTILGNNSAAPTRTRNQSGQHFKHDQDRILIDCGEGTQKRLLQYGINFQRISIILISHLHGDHFLGLMGLLNTMALNGRRSKITIISPLGLKNFYEVYAKTTDAHRSFDIDFIELHPNKSGTIETPRFHIKHIPVSHRISCFAYIIEQKNNLRHINIEACESYNIPTDFFNSIKQGEDYTDGNGVLISNHTLTTPPTNPIVYGYITDTLYRPDLAPAFAHCHTVYHEATYLHNFLDRAEQTHHSTAEQAGRFAQKASVNQLLIGHFSSRYRSTDQHLEESRTQFANTFVAEEGETYQIY